MAANSGAADFEHISVKVEPAGFADGLKLKRKNNIKDNSKVFVLKNEKNSIAIYENEGELNGSRIIGKYQELCFE